MAGSATGARRTDHPAHATPGIERGRAEINDLYAARWASATPAQQAVLVAIAQLAGGGAVERVRVEGNLDGRDISKTRAALMDKNAIDIPDHGLMQFTLPGFSRFVLDQIWDRDVFFLPAGTRSLRATCFTTTAPTRSQPRSRGAPLPRPGAPNRADRMVAMIPRRGPVLIHKKPYRPVLHGFGRTGCSPPAGSVSLGSGVVPAVDPLRKDHP